LLCAPALRHSVFPEALEELAQLWGELIEVATPKALEAGLVGTGIVELHAYGHHSRLHLVDHVSKGGHRLRGGDGDRRLRVSRDGGRNQAALDRAAGDQRCQRGSTEPSGLPAT